MKYVGVDSGIAEQKARFDAIGYRKKYRCGGIRVFFALVQKEKDSFEQKLGASSEKTGNIARFQRFLPENMSKFRLCECSIGIAEGRICFLTKNRVK